MSMTGALLATSDLHVGFAEDRAVVGPRSRTAADAVRRSGTFEQALAPLKPAPLKSARLGSVRLGSAPLKAEPSKAEPPRSTPLGPASLPSEPSWPASLVERFTTLVRAPEIRGAWTVPGDPEPRGDEPA
ncbi:hypothetical protein OG339_46315 [Streptosporangium sp. NBC_01495]|uniref:hypothetical protein n=1 Tax=Streptosporangium sp. NBC_01495 TaxID=2903899 RepID=UPI002E376A50|nr:hypothetical protein [Streptosporangium sp. NBC_01495]